MTTGPVLREAMGKVANSGLPGGEETPLSVTVRAFWLFMCY